jgi:hypothetical protein
MILDVLMVAVLLTAGNVAFRRFEPNKPLWRRALKVFIALGVTALISYCFGRTGVLIAIGIAALPLVYVHGDLAAPPRCERLDRRTAGEVRGATGAPPDRWLIRRRLRRVTFPEVARHRRSLEAGDNETAVRMLLGRGDQHRAPMLPCGKGPRGGHHRTLLSDILLA